MSYWLFKTEPDAYSISDLAAEPDKTTLWDGIRNYQARNMLRDQVKKGDKVFIYHSSCKDVGIVGTARVVRASYPDPTQFDPKEKYYDPKSMPDNPRWYTVDIKHLKTFKRLIPLAELKTVSALADMTLLKKGNRLSILPVSEAQWQTIVAMV